MKKNIILVLLVIPIVLTITVYRINSSKQHPEKKTIETDRTLVGKSNQMPIGISTVDAKNQGEDMQAIVNEEILPKLYASNDLDSLIAGALLVHFQEYDIPYSVENFLSSALSLDPDDPILLSVVTRYCGQFRERHQSYNRDELQVFPTELVSQYSQTNEFCSGFPYLQMLADATGNNAWVWINHAVRAKEDHEKALKYLERAANSTYFSDYDQELTTLIMDALLEHSANIQDRESLLLYGISKSLILRTQVPAFRLCIGMMKTEPRAVHACSTIAEYLLDGTTLIVQMSGRAIKTSALQTKGEEIEASSHFFDSDDTYKQYAELIHDPKNEAVFNKNIVRYVEVDAVQQTMIQLGLIEDDGRKLRRISSIDSESGR